MFSQAIDYLLRTFSLRDFRQSLTTKQKAKIATSGLLSSTNSIGKILISLSFSEATTMVAAGENNRSICGMDFSATDFISIFISLMLWQPIETILRNALLEDASKEFADNLSIQLDKKSYEVKLQDKTKGDFISAEFLTTNKTLARLPQEIINKLLPAVFDMTVSIVYVGSQFGLMLGLGFFIYALATVLVFNVLLVKYVKQKTEELSKNTNKHCEHKWDVLENINIVTMSGREDFEQKRHIDRRKNINDTNQSLNEANRTLDAIATLPLIVIYILYACRFTYDLANNGVAALQSISFLSSYIGVFLYNIKQLNTSIKSTTDLEYQLDDKVLKLLESKSNRNDTDKDKNEDETKTTNKKEVKPPTIPAEPKHEKKHSSRTAPSISFKNVTFDYDKSYKSDAKKQPLLNNITFDLKAGTRTALVGVNGCGKSSIINLLMGIEKPDSGTIEIDGQNITDIPPSKLRAMIANIFQSTNTFRLKSIQQNILYGDPSETLAADDPKSDERCVSIMREVGLETVIPKKDKDRGDAGLSGGEHQKICIARFLARMGLFKDRDDIPAIVIFDELTNHLDSLYIQSISKKMRKITAGKTVLYITHDFSTIEEGDNILVLENGTITEQGTHSELLTQNRTYAAFHRAKQITERTAIHSM